MRFSIKSQLGGKSTLLNASKCTNFIYRIDNIVLSESQITEIKETYYFRDKVAKIEEYGGKLVFHQIEKLIFNNNLILIDSALPEIVGELLLLSNKTGVTDLYELTEKLNRYNPLKFNSTHNHEYYKYKIKRLLSDAAVGMLPGKMWDGRYDATGGYLIVKKDGDVLCYHIYNKNEFEDYLLNNTMLETPDPNRHNFGFAYNEDGTSFFKLNLQIRFYNRK